MKLKPGHHLCSKYHCLGSLDCHKSMLKREFANYIIVVLKTVFKISYLYSVPTWAKCITVVSIRAIASKKILWMKCKFLAL